MNNSKCSTEGIRLAARLMLWGVLAIAVAKSASIGPDSYGYVANDATPYSFIDISSTGAAVLGGSDDDKALVNVGFPFMFYGRSFTSVCVSSNGLLSFEGCNADFANQDLSATKPAGDYPTVAPFWYDLSFAVSGAGAVYYQTLGAPGDRQFVVQWQNAYPLNGSKGITFQAVLHETGGRILFQYLDLDAGAGAQATFGGGASVGIRDTGGQSNGRALQWSYKAPVLHNGQAILFVPDALAPVISGMPAAGCELWPPDNKLIRVASVSASDAGSGLSSLIVTATSNEPEGKDPDIVITPSGSQYLVELRAQYTDRKDPDFWRKFPEQWPADTLTLGGVSYSKTRLVTILNSPSRGDVAYELAFELIGAKLNYVADPDPSIVPTINEADTWLAAHPLDGKQPVKEEDKKAASDLVKALVAYRKEIGTARIYTIFATAKDAVGNTSTAKAQCAVPHDQRK